MTGESFKAYQEVKDELHNVNIRLEGLKSIHSELKNDIKETKEEIKDIKGYFNGDIETPGLLIRIDRIEQERAKKATFKHLMISSILTLIVSIILMFLKG